MMFIIILLLSIWYFQWKIQKQRKELQYKEIEKLSMERMMESQKRTEAELRENFFRQLNQLAIDSSIDKKQRFLSDEEWDLILSNANVAFNGFTIKLEEKYSSLNADDIRYCCLVRMGLSQSEIAGVVCREKTSVKKRIRRIVLEKIGRASCRERVSTHV